MVEYGIVESAALILECFIFLRVAFTYSTRTRHTEHKKEAEKNVRAVLSNAYATCHYSLQTPYTLRRYVRYIQRKSRGIYK